MDWLNLVVERNIGDCHFHDVGGKPSARAALFYGFSVSVYTSIGIKKGREGKGGGKEEENKVRKVRKRKRKKPSTRNAGQDQMPRNLPRL